MGLFIIWLYHCIEALKKGSESILRAFVLFKQFSCRIPIILRLRRPKLRIMTACGHKHIVTSTLYDLAVIHNSYLIAKTAVGSSRTMNVAPLYIALARQSFWALPPDISIDGRFPVNEKAVQERGGFLYGCEGRMYPAARCEVVAPDSVTSYPLERSYPFFILFSHSSIHKGGGGKDHSASSAGAAGASGAAGGTGAS